MGQVRKSLASTVIAKPMAACREQAKMSGSASWAFKCQTLPSQQSHTSLATAVKTFAGNKREILFVQVELSDASMRPGHSQEWLSRVKANVLDSVNKSTAVFQCHSGTW